MFFHIDDELRVLVSAPQWTTANFGQVAVSGSQSHEVTLGVGRRQNHGKIPHTSSACIVSLRPLLSSPLVSPPLELSTCFVRHALLPLYHITSVCIHLPRYLYDLFLSHFAFVNHLIATTSVFFCFFNMCLRRSTYRCVLFLHRLYIFHKCYWHLRISSNVLHTLCT